jgi:adenylate kinase
LGKIAQRYINKGRLVPDEVAINMLENFLDAHPNSPGIIFDGFPRTIPQAEALKEILNRRGYDIAMVLNLDVAEDELIRRLLERGKKLGRADDNRKTIKARLDIYHSLTAPLTQFDASEGSLRTIRGSGDVESIYQQIKTHLRSCQTS